jgi:uncharacterized membrane protein
MNRVLKYAWYQLIVVIVATLFAAVTILIAVKYWHSFRLKPGKSRLMNVTNRLKNVRL